MYLALFLFYLASVAQALQIVFAVTAVSMILLPFIGCVASSDIEDNKDSDRLWERTKKNVKWAILLSALAIFVPSKTVMYVAAGLVAGETAIESQLGQKAYDALDSKLDEIINADQ